MTGVTTDEVPWHGYSTCPVCGSPNIGEGTVEDEDILVVSCLACGQTLCDEYIGED